MARDEAPPFARGETYYNGTAKESFYSDPLHLLGKEYVFEPNSPDGQNSGDSSGRAVRVRIVQNKAGANLLPKRIVRYKAIAPFGTQVDGYRYQGADCIAGVVDEFLPAAGVPDGDLFYVVIDGPTTVTAKASNGTLAIGSRIEAVAGTSASNADAGLVDLMTTTNTADADEMARVGRADVALGSGAGSATAIAAVVNIRQTF